MGGLCLEINVINVRAVSRHFAWLTVVARGSAWLSELNELSKLMDALPSTMDRRTFELNCT